MRPKVSILVGSGFSIPEGLPSVGQLNQRLSKIDESEILIHTDQTAIFLNGQNDPNRWSRRDERIFLQEFLEFYNAEVLKKTEEFHYETFYDYYSGYLTNRENKETIEDFYKKFNDRHTKGAIIYRDCYNRISDFNRSFNQLLASQLHKKQYFEDVSTLNYPPYDPFIGFLKDLLKTNDVKFHTLNHDLFFDWIGKNHSDLWQHFTDGYQLEGSPFYGTVSYDFNSGTDNKVHKTYYVKLERYTDKFDKPLSLFKLHGSIYNTIVYTPQPDQQRIRLKDNYAISQFYMETPDPKTGEPKLEYLLDEVSPDFLSGTTNKTRFYTRDPYYKNLFKHFENNLSESELLVVIGYGFNDGGINEYLEKYFLSRGKHMVIIDPYKPKSHLIEKYSATYIPKGVTQVTYQEYMELIPAELNPVNK
ncbi:SIR2-like protein [Ancylomarina subtilis]|uniref:SIR2-like protein n=1 Tax=Ancylomarina subtilis TaxID=1639035 RepID=A0A4Q7V5F2_9BACT|nr:SIR2 family protein [Ancylomarina subtilis]RZT91034.1 SIR2-like protein [Ancylomarina subtilis]